MVRRNKEEPKVASGRVRIATDEETAELLNLINQLNPLSVSTKEHRNTSPTQVKHTDQPKRIVTKAKVQQTKPQPPQHSPNTAPTPTNTAATDAFWDQLKNSAASIAQETNQNLVTTTSTPIAEPIDPADLPKSFKPELTQSSQEEGRAHQSRHSQRPRKHKESATELMIRKLIEGGAAPQRVKQVIAGLVDKNEIAHSPNNKKRKL